MKQFITKTRCGLPLFILVANEFIFIVGWVVLSCILVSEDEGMARDLSMLASDIFSGRFAPKWPFATKYIW